MYTYIGIYKALYTYKINLKFFKTKYLIENRVQYDITHAQ